MKIRLLSALCLCLFNLPLGAQEFRYNLGVGAGPTQAYGDVKNRVNVQSALRVYGDYQLNRYLSAGMEIQTGKAANGTEVFDPRLRQFSGYFLNKFSALSFNTKLSISRLLAGSRTNASRTNIYAGIGLGILKNKLYRNPEEVTFYVYDGLDTYEYPLSGSLNSSVVHIPVQGGLELPLLNRKSGDFLLDLNVQLNIVPGDELDGYDYNFNNRADYFTLLSAGLKYRFGYSSFLNRNIHPR